MISDPTGGSMNYEMDLKKYADFVRSEERSMLGGREIKPLEVEILALSNALGGECGELQNVVKKILSRDVFFKDSHLNDDFALEAGDTLWYLVRLIQKAGYSVEEIMQRNVDKLEAKYNTGVDTWRK